MTTTPTHLEPVTPEAALAALNRLASRAMGLTGADVERIVRQARLKARREKRSINYEDIEEGIRMDRPQVPYDLRWRFAIHESGHAVVHHALRLGPIHGLNIDAPGGGYSQLGFTASGSDTLGYREDMLAMLMAGRAAEQIVVGSVSAGSGGTDDSDLARATKLALAMERSLGFLKEREGNLLFPENLHWVGVEVETDLTRETPHLERASDWQDMGLDVNSLTIATGMVGVFIDAAKELAELINAYKIEEIERQMSGATPAKGEQLEALRARLAKKTSHFFPVIE